MASLCAGAFLAGRYRLIDRIGVGGMSVIWRAHDEVLERIVAMKVLADSLAADERLRHMVRAEARAAAQLVHPHVAAVHDYGEELSHDGTVTAFVVMELVTGEELGDRLTAGPLPWPEAVDVCAQVADALAAAHRIGIVHRDVTPANVMLTATGAKVLDFGIATRIGAPDDDDAGETFGTPAYVAPERLDGRPARPATDTYALGVLLFEMLTGQPPYPVDTWEELTDALRGEIPPLTGVPGLPPTVAEIGRRCLSRNVHERPTAHQIAEALRARVPPAPRPATAMPSRPATAVPPRPTRSLPTAPIPTPTTTGSRSPAKKLAAITASVVALGVAVLCGWLLRPDTGGNPVTLPVPVDTPAATPEPTLPTPDPTATRPEPTEPAVRDADTAVPSPRVTGPTRSRRPRTSAPAPPPTVQDAVTDFDALVASGIASGDIRDDVGQDLRQLAGNLRASLANGTADVPRQVGDLRRKVDDRLNEGAISDKYATALATALDRVSAAV